MSRAFNAQTNVINEILCATATHFCGSTKWVGEGGRGGRVTFQFFGSTHVYT